MKKIRLLCFLIGKYILVIMMLISCKSSYSQDSYYTRGIGIYPGNQQENFSPNLVPDNEHYRNIAKLRSAYHSSSYDYNLTAQLITDGVITNQQPSYINVSTQAGDLLKNEREWFFDGKSDSKYCMSGDDIYLQLALNNCHTPIDRITLSGSVSYDQQKENGYEIVCYGSNDKMNWEVLGKDKGNGFIGKEQEIRFPPMPKANTANKPAIPSNFPKMRPSRILTKHLFLIKLLITYITK